MAAIKEQVAAQFQQLQQRMGPHLQYLPQLPQLPHLPQFPQFAQLPNFAQIPNMPPLPEYHNLVLQRLATMIGGARPGAGEEEPSARAAESAWQYLSPFSNKAATPPPAYDEIFPERGGDLDTKRASAANAAADAVADAKCAALFDQPQTSTSTGATTTVAAVESTTGPAEDKAEDSEDQEIPALLQIGRKDAITQEQQATLRRAHAQNLKKLSWDRNLFFIWVCFCCSTFFWAILAMITPG